MIEFLMLGVAATATNISPSEISCNGISVIEGSINDRPLPFASLREQGKEMAMVRDASGRRVQREVTVTNVKAIAGFSRCRFVYSGQIDLACYVGSSLPSSDAAAIEAKLQSIGDAVGQCLTNQNLTRGREEDGSTLTVTFGGGPRQPFWQVSMVPTLEDFGRSQPEVLVLGPKAAEQPRATPAPRAKAKAKRKAR